MSDTHTNTFNSSENRCINSNVCFKLCSSCMYSVRSFPHTQTSTEILGTTNPNIRKV